MPRVSAFYGIVIVMFFNEEHHQGRPHFHARYAGAWASYSIDQPAELAGGLPPRARLLILEWAAEHGQDLLDNWERARRHEPLAKIAPLP